MNLLRKIYEAIGPELIVDNDKKTFSILDEGSLFLHLTEAYYIFRGYRKLDDKE